MTITNTLIIYTHTDKAPYSLKRNSLNVNIAKALHTKERVHNLAVMDSFFRIQLFYNVLLTRCAVIWPKRSSTVVGFRLGHLLYHSVLF